MKRMACNKSRWKAANQSEDWRIRRCRWLITFSEIIAVYCEDHFVLINPLYGQNAVIFSDKACGIHGNHCVL
jgi:hypothetical protein